jgi:hypothetical protein
MTCVRMVKRATPSALSSCLAPVSGRMPFRVRSIGVSQDGGSRPRGRSTARAGAIRVRINRSTVRANSTKQEADARIAVWPRRDVASQRLSAPLSRRVARASAAATRGCPTCPAWSRRGSILGVSALASYEERLTVSRATIEPRRHVIDSGSVCFGCYRMSH